ncbi:MAG: hypothetical protein ACSLFR_02815 [Solirubrobacteraceae bacterium]
MSGRRLTRRVIVVGAGCARSPELDGEAAMVAAVTRRAGREMA